MNVLNDESAWNIIQLSLVYVEYLVCHLQPVSIRRAAIQFYLSISSLY